jgi:hypothetical protein
MTTPYYTLIICLLVGKNQNDTLQKKCSDADLGAAMTGKSE